MPERSLSRLDLLRFLERVQLADLERTRRWIKEEEQRQAVQRQRAERARPTPDWVLQQSLNGQHPVAVHVGDCHMAGKRIRPIGREDALRARVEGVEGCGHCGVDAALGYLEGAG